MTYFIVGLGNPGEGYEKNRHNIGRYFLTFFAEEQGFSPWRFNKDTNSLESEGKIGKHDVVLVLPEGFMNNTGRSVAKYITSKKKINNLIAAYDDIDLPIGKVKISQNRGDGGHNGVGSMIKSLGTKNFLRLRIGITPTNFIGRLKKPRGSKAVLDFLMKDTTKKEDEFYEKKFKEISKALVSIMEEGSQKAMNLFN